MQKLFYLLFDSLERPGRDLREALEASAAGAIRKVGGRDAYLFVHDEEVAGGQPIRRSEPPIRGFVSFWLEDAAARGPVESALAEAVARIAGYLVLESRPVVHPVRAGERSEGMKQITCITRRADLDADRFIEIWHGDHARVAVETQSTFGYVRNEIFRPLTPDAPDQWTAFVEESFPLEALHDPKVFYAAEDEAELAANTRRMVDSCARFLDFEPMEVTYVSEYYLG